MPDALLIHADSLLDANMFVATGITAGDPFTYIEAGDRRIIVTNQLEVDLVRRESTANEIWMVDEFGGRDLVLDGWPLDDARMETVRRMLERAGLDAVAVPPSFPLALADYLRGKGITLTPDRVLFDSRRRHKDARQLQGVRTAQRATEAAFDAARGMIGSASPDAAAPSSWTARRSPASACAKRSSTRCASAAAAASRRSWRPAPRGRSATNSATARSTPACR